MWKWILKTRKRGFNGGNFSHGPEVHHTRERAGLEPFYFLPYRTAWKRHLNFTWCVWLCRDRTPRKPWAWWGGGGMMNQQHFEHKAVPGSWELQPKGLVGTQLMNPQKCPGDKEATCNICHVPSAKCHLMNMPIQKRNLLPFITSLHALWPQSSQYQQLGSQDRMEGVR